jgi:soluble cytochrome b562
MSKLNIQLNWQTRTSKDLVQMSNYASNSDKPSNKKKEEESKANTEPKSQNGAQKFVQSIKDQRRNAI